MSQIQIHMVGQQKPVLPHAQTQAGTATQNAKSASAGTGTAAAGSTPAAVVDIGASSAYQEFAVDPKSRQEAIHEALQRFIQRGESANPFEGTGDAYQQHMVFSQHLGESGFFDGKTEEEVSRTEGLLKDITSAMDMVSPNNMLSKSASSPSAAAAQIAFSSSVQALRQFVDSELSGDLADSFSSLVDSYESYNEPVVDAHWNASDRQDNHLAAASKSKSYAKLAATAPKKSQAEARLGRIKKSSAQKQKIRDAASSYFQDVRSGTINVDSAISKLQSSFLNDASGGAQDSEMRSVLIRRNSALFQQINSYWGVLMRTR